MSDQLALPSTTTDFQKRMFEQIREKLGQLMTDEELKVVVAEATRKAFFEPRITPRQYGGQDVKDPLFVEMMREELAPRFEVAIKEWAAAHPDVIEKALQETLGKGIVGVLVAHLENRLNGELSQLRQALQVKGIV